MAVRSLIDGTSAGVWQKAAAAAAGGALADGAVVLNSSSGATFAGPQTGPRKIARALAVQGVRRRIQYRIHW